MIEFVKSLEANTFLSEIYNMHLTIIAGARPNFVKIAPIIHAIESHNSDSEAIIEYSLVHTGQHYDDAMSEVFFNDLRIPKPNINLQVGSGTQAQQTAKIMVAFEAYLIEHMTDCLIVVGDVNSTIACSIVAKKMGVRVAHVEGGLRSGDMSMPEEINRLLTDSITDYFFTTSSIADENLAKEGVAQEQIFMVGNTMIDSLVSSYDSLKQPAGVNDLLKGQYFLLTLHRPSNVDDVEVLSEMLSTIDDMAEGDEKIIFPIHPRTKAQLSQGVEFKNIHFLPPLPYLEFLYLMRGASAIITDSGGIQEESTYLKVPCLTLRENTERPETISIGSNVLIGKDMSLLKSSLESIRKGEWKKGGIPDLWDGKAAIRIIEQLRGLLSATN